jgi:hypothetical protein
MCVPKKKDQETVHKEDVQKKVIRAKLRRPEYRPELLRILLRAGRSRGRSCSGWYSGLHREPKNTIHWLRTSSRCRGSTEGPCGETKRGELPGQVSNPRSLDFKKKQKEKSRGARRGEVPECDDMVLRVRIRRRRGRGEAAGAGALDHPDP